MKYVRVYKSHFYQELATHIVQLEILDTYMHIYNYLHSPLIVNNEIDYIQTTLASTTFKLHAQCSKP